MEHGIFGSMSLPDSYSRFPMESNGFQNQDFCTEDNINQCLAYISQELCALGYPSIYNDTSSCPFAVNCDIIKFLNVTFDILHNNRQLVQIKEDLDNRNRSLSGDLNAYKKKLNHTKNHLEQSERKCHESLERERQLKEKCEQLQLQLKVEKDEAKKAASSSQQQKVIFHHEIRKLEKEITQMKAKMNQLLADKNSGKKVASMSSSYVLQRTDGQRGKWKTGAVSNSRLEEMFSSVITDQESRCKEITEEMVECCSCLKFVQREILDLMSSLKKCDSEKEYRNCPNASVNVPDEYFYTMFKVSGKNIKDDFKEKLDLLKTVILESCRHQNLNNDHRCYPREGQFHEISMERCNSNVDGKLKEEEVMATPNESCGTKSSNGESDELKTSGEKLNLEVPTDEWKAEQEKIDNEKLSLIQAASCLRKEKEAVLAQKLGLIKLEMKILQNKVPSSPEQVLTFTPATSVIITHDGSPIVSERISFGMPNSVQAKSPLPSWIQQTPENHWISKSENSLPAVKESPKMNLSTMLSSKSEDLAMYSKSTDLHELPKWATSNHNVVIECPVDASAKEINEQDIGDGCSNEDSMENDVASPLSPTEEQYLEQLKIVAEDMERKRSNATQ